MKGERTFILKILKVIENLREGVVAYAYLDGNATMSFKWYTICVSDYDLYRESKFMSLTRAWHKSSIAHGIRVCFAYCNPSEKRLAELLNADNLIMNID